MSVGDAVLWERWRGWRDADAFAELVARHSGMVYGTCRRVLGDATAAEDAAQECFLELMDARVRVKESLAPWLHTVAVRRSIDAQRSDARRRHRHERFQQPLSSTVELPEAELLAAVDKAIAELPDRFRLPIVFRFLEGQTHEAIAERLGLSESTVRYRIERGIDRVRAILSRRGLTSDSVRLSGMLLGLPVVPVPTALIARLGCHALAQAAPLGATSLIGATQLLGGLLIVKKVLVILAIVAAVAVSWWGLQSVTSAPPVQDPLPPVLAKAENVPQPKHSEAVEPHPDKAPSAIPEANPPEPASTPDSGPKEGVPVQGIVLDRNDQPVPDAEVGGKVRDPRAARVKSRADGTFSLSFAAAANELMLLARKDGYQSEPAGPLKLRNEGLTGIVLKLTVPCTGAISGTVVDASGKAVPGQSLWFDPGRTRYLMPKASVPTDDKGAFLAENLAPGRYGIVPVSGMDSGFLTNALATVDLKPGQVVQNLKVVYDRKDVNAIAGRVIDRAGKPVAEAMVTCHHPINGWARSDAEGKFRITGLPEGTCALTVQHEKHAMAMVRNVTSGTADLEVVMSDFGVIEGQVLQADSRSPITHFQVFRAEGEAAAVDEVQYNRGASFDDAQGRFSLPDSQPGAVRITVCAEGFAPASKTTEAVEGQTQTLEFVLDTGRRIEGQVLNTADRPVAGANLYLGSVPMNMDAQGHYVARSGSDGHFVIEHAPQDVQTLGTLHPDYGSATVPAKEPVRIVLLQGGTLEGVVTVNGEPVSNVPVLATVEGAPETTPCRSDVDGSYRITGLAPGPVVVVAVSPIDQRRVMRSVAMKEGATVKLDLAFDNGESTVEGRLTYRGNPAPRNQVVLEGSSGDAPVTVEADAEGLFRFENVPAGTAKLHGMVEAEDTALSRTVDVNVPEGETLRVDIDITPAVDTHITGSVAGLPAEGVAQVLVFALPGPYELPAPEEGLKAVMELNYRAAAVAPVKDGVFEINGLDPADYTLLVVVFPATGRKNLPMAVAPVTLQDSGPVSVQFDLGGN